MIICCVKKVWRISWLSTYLLSLQLTSSVIHYFIYKIFCIDSIDVFFDVFCVGKKTFCGWYYLLINIVIVFVYLILALNSIPQYFKCVYSQQHTFRGRTVDVILSVAQADIMQQKKRAPSRSSESCITKIHIWVLFE